MFNTAAAPRNPSPSLTAPSKHILPARWSCPGVFRRTLASGNGRAGHRLRGGRWRGGWLEAVFFEFELVGGFFDESGEQEPLIATFIVKKPTHDRESQEHHPNPGLNPDEITDEEAFRYHGGP